MNVLDFLNANKYSEKNTFVEQAQFIKDNWGWLKYSYAIAIKVRSRMDTLGMTQKQLSERLGCSQQHISVLLNGRVNMTLETLAKLEDALGVGLLNPSLTEFQEGSQPAYLCDSAVYPCASPHPHTKNLVASYKPRKKERPEKERMKSLSCRQLRLAIQNSSWKPLAFRRS